MPLLILTVGVPSAGKSTWVQEYVNSHKATKVVSNDDIREDLFGTRECDSSQNGMVYSEAHTRAAKYLAENYDVIVDGTNVDLTEWLAYKEISSRYICILAAKVFNVTPEEALERQNNRERKVPKEVIIRKWKSLEDNRKYIPFIFNYSY